MGHTIGQAASSSPFVNVLCGTIYWWMSKKSDSLLKICVKGNVGNDGQKRDVKLLTSVSSNFAALGSFSRSCTLHVILDRTGLRPSHLLRGDSDAGGAVRCDAAYAVSCLGPTTCCSFMQLNVLTCCTSLLGHHEPKLKNWSSWFFPLLTREGHNLPIPPSCLRTPVVWNFTLRLCFFNEEL